MGKRRHVVLFDASTASTGAWFDLDSRYEEFAQRAIQGTVASGDTITIQGTTRDVRGPDKSFLTTLPATDITNIASYTANFSDILNGNFRYIRVVKTGTNGASKVQGFI